MKNLRLSIVLPVYNVEPYVERCIRSLQTQDIAPDEFEVIVVNDGSPDNSREVVARLMMEFSNIVLIDQENRGVSMARNAGIERARGEYLLFVDPDDYLLQGTLGAAIAQARDAKAQVSFLGYNFLTVEGRIRAKVIHKELCGRVFAGTEAYPLSRGDGKTDPDRSWAILYNRGFIIDHKLRYVAGIPYLEDGEFIARVLCLADRCIFSGKQLYQRTTRPGSATNSGLFYEDRSIDGFIVAAKSLKAFRANPNFSARHRRFLNQPICKFTLLSLTPSCSLTRYKRFYSTVRRLQLEGLARIETIGCNNLYKLEAQLFNALPVLYFLHRLIGAPLVRIIPLSKGNLAGVS